MDTFEGFRWASILGIMRQCLEHYEDGFPKLPASLDRERAEIRMSGPAPLIQALGQKCRA